MFQFTTSRPLHRGLRAGLSSLDRRVSGGKFLLAWFPSAWVLLGTSSASAANKYLLLNYGASDPSAAPVMDYVADKFGAANQVSALKVGEVLPVLSRREWYRLGVGAAA